GGRFVAGGWFDDRADALADYWVGKPDDRDVGDAGQGEQGLFHLAGADVESAADDDVLHAPGNAQVAAVVESAHVAGAPPALVVDGVGGEVGPAPVFEQPAGPAVADLAIDTGGGRVVRAAPPQPRAPGPGAARASDP